MSSPWEHSHPCILAIRHPLCGGSWLVGFSIWFKYFKQRCMRYIFPYDTVSNTPYPIFTRLLLIKINTLLSATGIL